MWYLSTVHTVGPEHGSLIWNLCVPMIYHIQIEAHRTDPTRIQQGPIARSHGKTFATHSTIPYHEINQTLLHCIVLDESAMTLRVQVPNYKVSTQNHNYGS